MRLSEKEYQELAKKCPKLQTLSGIQEPAKPKYHNVKVYLYPDRMVSFGEKLEGHGKPEVYDSIKEYERGQELALMARGGLISDLKRQVPLLIQPETICGGKTVRAIVYRADYCYKEKGLDIVEDVKPLDRRTGTHKFTKDFALKWKLLQVMYPDRVFRLY